MPRMATLRILMVRLVNSSLSISAHPAEHAHFDKIGLRTRTDLCSTLLVAVPVLASFPQLPDLLIVVLVHRCPKVMLVDQTAYCRS